MQLDIRQIRCIYCDSNGLDIYKEIPVCDNCGHVFSNFEGIKFLGIYNISDTLGLLEITSKISPDTDPVKTRKYLENSETRLSEGFKKLIVDAVSNDSEKGVACGSTQMANLVAIRQWGALELITNDFNIDGKFGLDIGAGLGSDSIRLINKGAQLVCLDYNPISVKNGALIVPEAQWLGGNSEFLPFVSDTFDFTMANATLHHMHDQAGSVKEMFRVTKPGGFIILISDPFVQNVKTLQEHEDREMAIYDKHPMVLNGVNEGVIPFNYYAEFLEELDPQARLLTMRIHQVSEATDSPTYWTLSSKDKAYLGARSGNISSVIKVSSKEFPAPIKGSEEIPMAALLSTIGDPRKSINFLLPYFSEDCFDAFPFLVSSKFTLMNGWHAEQDFSNNWRKGYNRARIYYTHLKLFKTREIQVKRDSSSSADAIKMYISINGVRVKDFQLILDTVESFALNEIEDYMDRNVIEIGVADVSENKGAIWSIYDFNKVFFVQSVASG